MPRLIVLRHAAKQYKNRDNRNIRYDSPIIEEKREESIAMLKKILSLLDKNPTRIISSPYLRTRQTSQMLVDITSCNDLLIDRELSNFLGWNKQFSEEDFYPNTFEFLPYPPENIDDFRIRAYNSISNIYYNLKDDDEVWVFTHRFIITSFLKKSNVPSTNLEPLEGIIIHDEKIGYISNGEIKYP